MSAVLVVDDSLTVRMHLEEAFSAAGFEPVLAADVASARRALASRPFALAVLDVLLPDGDGLELLAEIKGSPQHAGTPVVLLSTEAEVQHRVRGLQTGADEYVGKPYDAAQVVARARELVRRRAGADLGAAARPVLLVDDSVTAREELRDALERAGLQVVTVGSGEEGLRVAAERRPRAIVVDGVMPGMDGATFIREIRADAALRTTPCILLTASGSVGELSALDAGADAYVRKDEDGNELVLARLQALLRSATSAPEETAAGAPTARRILVLGASTAPLGDVAETLRLEGHDVVTAATSEEALALLAVDRVDAILVEATRQGDASAAACLRIRGDARWRHVPLLVVGERSEPEATVDALAGGADDYVPLSSGPLVARARVHAQLRRSQFEDENRTREGYARSAAILETISDAFFAVGRDWRFVYVNHALEEMVGAPRDALAGEVLWERCPFLARGQPRAELDRAVEGQVPVTFEAREPGERWIEVRAFPHRDGLTAYLRDVTERRRTQEVQAHLLGITGHDLRTPISVVRVSLDVALRDPQLSERHRRVLGRAAGAAARMSRLVNDLLDYSRARLGRGIPIAPQPTDLDAICRDIVEEVSSANGGRKIAYHPGADGSGEWDPDRIGQVLTNLLTNAVRYSQEGAAVSLAWSAEGDRRVIAVHNEGSPIDPALLANMFEPFERGRTAASGGAGLGLFIVREIVRAHGGSVAVTSEAGRGTTFYVNLPARAG
ncbi:MULTISPECIES: response regulator [Anaeromyxobacter]|uniref:response regulator n=1 Tax=Anaeromyxobacter TaxID=161492 RepID=UPI001F582AC8|nr:MULTISPECIES: response regulator [unclassified Anaeromyxobacter]